MAEVLVTFKVLPAEAGLDIEELSNRIKDLKIAGLKSVEKEPIAFGLIALKPSFVTKDAEGVADEIEAALKGIDGVGEVEVIAVSRLLG